MSMATRTKTCFIIMPFSKTNEAHDENYWTTHYEFLKTVIKEVDSTLEVRRSQALRGNIIGAIIKDLVHSEIVVADITDANPNVYWELGVRQSFAHGTVTVAEFGTRRPSDIGPKGTLEYYPSNHTKNEGFRALLKQAVRDCLDHPERPDSHVLSELTGRGSVFEIIHRQEILRRLDGLVAELDVNLELIDKVVTTLKENKNKKPEQYTLLTLRLPNACGELLISERYLDADKNFYEWAFTYYRILTNVNEQLGAFEINKESTQIWLMDIIVTSKTPLSETVSTFKKKVVEARETVAKRL
ncbi:MAG: hypothetical protein ACHQ03_00925 [Candidatus Bathyarchaeia archaeon]